VYTFIDILYSLHFALPKAKGEVRVISVYKYDALRAYGRGGIAPFILNVVTKCS